jgi:hypothetical protein
MAFFNIFQKWDDIIREGDKLQYVSDPDQEPRFQVLTAPKPVPGQSSLALARVKVLATGGETWMHLGRNVRKIKPPKPGLVDVIEEITGLNQLKGA